MVELADARPTACGSERGLTQGAWGLGDHDASLEVHANGPDRRQKHSGEASESWTLSLGVGSYAYLEHVLPPSYVVPELKATVWVRSDRTPLQFRVRVTLPASGTSPQPLTVWLDGDSEYAVTGRWQELVANDLPLKLQRQVRSLRLQYGPSVSSEGAYIDRAAVNVYSGKGRIRVWLDDLGLEGSIGGPEKNEEDEPIRLASAETNVPNLEGPRELGVQLRGSLWLARGRPFFPRVADIRTQAGPPLPWDWREISGRGWNSVWTSAETTEQTLHDVRDSSLLLVGPPPVAPSPLWPLPESAPVLAWHVPSSGSVPSKNNSQTIAQLRQVAPESRRPLVAHDDTILATHEARRNTDVLTFRRVAYGTSFPLQRWASWISDRNSAPLSKAPFLVSLGTSPSIPAMQQARRAGFDGPTPCISFEGLRQLVRWSLAVGANGIVSSLDTEPLNERSQQRTLDVWELVNLELELIDPWLSADQPRQTISSSVASIRYLVLQTDRSVLAVPLLPLQDAEHLPPIWQDKEISVTIPYNSSSAIAYELVGDTLRPMRSMHRPGGLHVTAAKFSPSQIILVTSEPIVLTHARRQLASQCDRRLELLARVYRDEAQRIADITQQIKSILPEPDTVDRWARASAQLGVQADDARARGEKTLAMQRYEVATTALARGTRAAWQIMSESLPQPTASPGGLVFDTLPVHQSLLKRLETSHLGAELVPGGDMESLERLTQSGWKHWQSRESGSLSQVLVSVHGDRPRQGQRCLRMEATPSTTSGSVDATPNVWVQTPSIGQGNSGLVLFHGWLRVESPVQGHDGFLIYDSIAGPSMGLRYYGGNEWQEFSLYRFVNPGESIQMTLALTGPGKVDIDEISVTRIAP
ncbi:MAG: hypothetical protein O3C60_09385 [Planctomycetota bacterium]|nr:hypothetical protein [Planctomycetota bacterium]